MRQSSSRHGRRRRPRIGSRNHRGRCQATCGGGCRAWPVAIVPRHRSRPLKSKGAGWKHYRPHGWRGNTGSVPSARRRRDSASVFFRFPHAGLSYSILRLTTPPLWPSWTWWCRLPADCHAIAFATALLARNSIPEPGGFAGLARYRNFLVHAF